MTISFLVEPNAIIAYAFSMHHSKYFIDLYMYAPILSKLRFTVLLWAKEYYKQPYISCSAQKAKVNWKLHNHPYEIFHLVSEMGSCFSSETQIPKQIHLISVSI